MYNVSRYLEDHPGGIPVLLEAAGQDATAAFEDVGHSDDARELLQPFLIGELPPEVCTYKPSTTRPADSFQNRQETVETYRPEYKVVSTVSELRRKPSLLSRIRKALVRLSLAAPAAYLATQAYRRRLHLNWDLLRSQGHLLDSGPTNGAFWVGFGVSSALGAGLFVAAASYINNLLDATTDFRRFPPTQKFARRPLPHTKKADPPVLHPREYRALPLVRKDRLSHDSYRFVFALPRETDTVGVPTGQHVSIRATVDGEVVTRSYTPTSNNADRGRLELVIKVYRDGKLTSYLARLPLNATVEVAGPKGAMRYHRGLCRHLGMVAGGSGITPMYQVIRAVCEDERDDTTISLLYANRTEEDILLRAELDAFACRYPAKFRVHYVLDRPPAGWSFSSGYVTREMIAQHLPAAGPDTKILLCGPPGMIQATTAHLAELGFARPGALSKPADQVFVF